MDAKRTRGRPRKGMLDEFLEDGSYAQTKRRAHIERVGGVGCRGPALGQSTDDDDDLSTTS